MQFRHVKAYLSLITSAIFQILIKLVILPCVKGKRLIATHVGGQMANQRIFSRANFLRALHRLSKTPLPDDAKKAKTPATDSPNPENPDGKDVNDDGSAKKDETPKILALTALLIFPIAMVPDGNAEIYKWRDDNGTTHYSQARPINKRASNIELVTIQQSKEITKDALELTKVQSKADMPINALPSPTLNIPAQVLAQGYLAVGSKLSLIEMLKDAPNVTVYAELDGKVEEINLKNRNLYLNIYQQRLDAYEHAINKRGFSRINGIYDVKSDAKCERIWLPKKTVVIEQDQFKVRVVQGTLTLHGAVVESKVAFENRNDGASQLIGSASDGRITLLDDNAECGLQLIAKDANAAEAVSIDRQKWKEAEVDFQKRRMIREETTERENVREKMVRESALKNCHRAMDSLSRAQKWLIPESYMSREEEALLQRQRRIRDDAITKYKKDVGTYCKS